MMMIGTGARTGLVSLQVRGRASNYLARNKGLWANDIFQLHKMGPARENNKGRSQQAAPIALETSLLARELRPC